ncbi:sugar kinase [Pseudonocardia sp. KRD291]|uniref:sugar kinase n=1 Tax=Pseudonocardia sp. KRD291 TaxID=2792007 RepID=UPI001C49F08F|nr:sugar kinase [Pseudonocardia sp. KRD291]MBW0103232.1 sugar kinase [Pseudonocardia sp. KRD291]
MDRNGPRAAPVVCLGEALALVPDLAAGPGAATAAGAEVNVACGLAAAGVPVTWVGRLGADGFGAVVRAQLDGRGVDTAGVQTDPSRPTGRYAKSVGAGVDGEPATRMHYLRAGSAASAMGPDFLGLPAVARRLAAAPVVHVGGITAALSQSCAAMMTTLLAAPRPGRLVFDVNWREQMWPAGDPAPVLRLAQRADVVLLGADEARRVCGTDDPAALRRLLPAPELLVLKDGARRALAITRDGEVVSRPALQVDVVEPVGAGDAFAAGLVTGLVRGEPLPRCLRRGHLGAAAVLTVATDSAPPLRGPLRGPLPESLLEATEREWSDVRVDADGFREGVR